MSPFSKILFAKFGPNGNYGQPRGYIPGNVEELKDAEQGVCLRRTYLLYYGKYTYLIIYLLGF